MLQLRLRNMTRLTWRTSVLVFIMSLLILDAGATGAHAENALHSHLVVGTKHVPPFAIKTEDGHWTGISMDLWKQIAAELELDYELRELTLDELLGGLRIHSIDVAVAALTVTAERETYIDFTHPFHMSGLGIAVSTKSRSGWLVVVERFISLTFLKVVTALIVVLFIAGFLVWVFEHKSNAEQFGGDPPKGLGAAFWWSAVTMTTVGYGDKAPKTLGGRLVALIWMFTSIIIISSFTAAITSALTVGQLQLKVRGPDDLPKVTVATIKSSTSETYLMSKKLAYQTYNNPLEALRAVASGQEEAMVYDAPVLRYLVSREFGSSVRVLPQTFEPQYYAIGLVEGSALREPVNRALIEKINSPQWQDILYKYLGKSF